MADLFDEVTEIALRAKQAGQAMAAATFEVRNAALCEMAASLRTHAQDIIDANGKDVALAREKGTKESLIDRLLLNESRIEDMASALEDLSRLDDPLGKVQEKRTLYNGLELERISVPLGVVAVIYEARPNVTSDAAGLCVKSGNACILRGGSMAAHSNEILAHVLHEAAVSAGLPRGCVGLIASTDRAATDVLMQLHDYIDVLVPRGGAGLIAHCVEHSKVPVIETGTGNCHVYVHASANFEMAKNIVLNAKTRRFGVCNAAESLLVDASIADDFLPAVIVALSEKGVRIHGDEQAQNCAARAEAGVDVGAAVGTEAGLGKTFEGAAQQAAPSIQCVPATEDDWAREYLAPDLAVKCVSGYKEAISHINRYGTKHSEAIVANSESAEGRAAIEAFLAQVDAAALYVNASTAFTDGGQFGLGAEIGISTQKLHARGPFAHQALTSYKYIVRGNGQVRS